MPLDVFRMQVPWLKPPPQFPFVQYTHVLHCAQAQAQVSYDSAR